MRVDVATAIAVTYDENGMLGVRIDGFGDNPGGHGRHSMSIYGLISRPLPANDAGVGPECLIVDGSREGFAWVATDARDDALLPQVAAGSSMLYNSRGTFLLLDYDTETTTLYQTRSGGSKAHTLVLGEDVNGAEYTELRAANGAYIAQKEASTVIRHTGNALLEVKPEEIVFNGAVNITSSLSVGGASAQPLVTATALASALTAAASAFSSPGLPVDTTMMAALLSAIISALGTVASTTSLKGI